MVENLNKIIQFIISQKPTTKAQFNDAKRKICGKLKIKQPSNRSLIKAYQNLIKKKSIKPKKELESLMKKANVRTLSGVAIITSLTKSYACPGKCIYCPTEARMPKSYLASEPAAARALALKFDPYEQMKKRIEMLEENGHVTDKIEFIIKGGTWNAYPLKYQYWFILESFRACNHLLKKQKNHESKKQWLNGTTEELSKLLEKEQNYNDKHAKHKIIGLTLETRPDAVTPETIYHMRKLGCTRIELGLQAPDDEILKLNKRGHTVQQFKDAMLLLRSAGFKVDLHFMPDLPGTTPKHDIEMYKLLFSDPSLKPDMVKIYPCTVIRTAELYKWFKSGKYKPYSEKKLFEALIEMKINTPRYCRISRLIRDIPNPDIQAGNVITNLRENLQKKMRERGLKCKCLRCREVGHVLKKTIKQVFIPSSDRGKSNKTKLFIDKYQTVGGKEYFISFEDPKRTTVYGFLRLRIPEKELPTPLLQTKLPEIKNCAFIRELHVYGQLVSLGERKDKASQHKGLGKKLVKEAEKIAIKKGYNKIAIISGVGVRDYYRKLRYKKRGTYMVKKLT